MTPAAPAKGRFFLPAFIVALLLAGFGAVHLGPVSVGGSTRGLFVVVLAAYLLARTVARDWKPPTLHRDPVIWLLGVGIASAAWNEGHHLTTIWETLFPALVGYVATRWLVEARQEAALLLLRTLAVALTGIVAYNILQHPDILVRFQQVDTSDHHTHAAMRLVLALPLTVGLLQSDARYRPLYVVLLVFQIFGLVTAGSRIGWMALGVVGLYGLVAHRSRVARLAFLACLLAVVSLAMIAPVVRANFLTLGSVQRQENFWHRYLIYSVATRVFLDHPVAGIGFSNETFTARGAALVPGFYYAHPHNLVLSVAVYLGFLGLIPLALICVRLVQALKRLSLDPRVPRPVLDGITAGLVGFAVVNVGETALSSVRATLLTFVLLGVVLGRARAVEAQPLREPATGGR